MEWTVEDFRKYLVRRHAQGESLAVIGESLGVSRQAVSLWVLGGALPSRTVLLLARLLAQRDAGQWPLG